MGFEVATDLMELLPKSSTEELVTRTDMHAQTARLQGEMSELRTELRGGLAGLRADFLAHQVATKSDLLSLESRLDTRFERRFSELKTSTNRMIAASMAANAVAVVTALVS